jgi:hypothetical protein
MKSTIKTLCESDVIRIMREEWDKMVLALNETVEVKMTSPKVIGDDDSIVSPELKVLHKNSGIRYTVDSVSNKDVILRTPEGKKFLVDQTTLETEYELD